jgi:hypothetical protein
VTIAFLGYEKSGDDWTAIMEIRNQTSRPIHYSPAYNWDSPQIDYQRRAGSAPVRLPAKSIGEFRVLVMTTDYDWRVGIDYEIGLPSWANHLPMWLIERARRVGLLQLGGEKRAWSPQIQKPTLDQRSRNHSNG